MLKGKLKFLFPIKLIEKGSFADRLTLLVQKNLCSSGTRINRNELFLPTDAGTGRQNQEEEKVWDQKIAHRNH
jgi:hypothetical protein